MFLFFFSFFSLNIFQNSIINSLQLFSVSLRLPCWRISGWPSALSSASPPSASRPPVGTATSGAGSSTSRALATPPPWRWCPLAQGWSQNQESVPTASEAPAPFRSDRTLMIWRVSSRGRWAAHRLLFCLTRPLPPPPSCLFPGAPPRTL